MNIRKIGIVALVALMVTPVFAQEKETAAIKTSKLPKQGDFAIGADLLPLFRSLGNVFWGEPTGSQGFGGTPSINYNALSGTQTPTISIMGKYMITDSWAAKMNLGINNSNLNEAFNVIDDAARLIDPLSNKMVQDLSRSKTRGFSLNLGAEYRLGTRSVQGFVGAGLIFGYANSYNEFEYGNAITEGNQTPTSVFPMTAGHRSLKSYNTSPFTYVGAELNLGVEYFFAPKIAVGGQVNLSYIHQSAAKTATISEYFNTATQTKGEWTNLEKAKSGSWVFGTNNIGTSLYLILYF